MRLALNKRVYAVAIGALLVTSLIYGAHSTSSITEPMSPKMTGDSKIEQETKNSVVLRTSDPSQLQKLARKNNIKILDITKLPSDDALITLEKTESSAQLQELTLKADDIITGDIAPNYTYKLEAVPNDTNYGDQWNLAKIAMPQAWDITTGDANTKIAVLDSGVLSSQQWTGQGPYAQPDFPSSKIWNNSGEVGITVQEGAAPNCTSRTMVLDKKCNNLDDDGNGFVDDWRGWDFMGGRRGNSNTCPNHNDGSRYNDAEETGYLYNDNDPQPYSCDDPTNANQLNKTHYNNDCGYGVGACYIGHGTNVASVASAATNNSSLIAGIDWNAKIMNVRIMDGYGIGNSTRVAAGVEYATAMGADVINLSLALFSGDSCTVTDQIVEQSLVEAKAAGVVVVAASGNGGENGVCYPGRSVNAIGVGASDQQDKKATFSTYGAQLELIAPGVAIPAANAPSSARNSNYHTGASGTSLATPHVTGVAAGLKALKPEASVEEIRDYLTENTDKVAEMNGADKTDKHGYGRLNAFKAYEYALNQTGTYGNIRLFTCDGDKYMVERGIYKKRLLTQVAINHWNLEDLDYNTGDYACDYPTYELPLDRIVRSRSTDKSYLVDDGTAYLIHSKAAANSWGVENFASKEYALLNGASINFLTVRSTLPAFTPNVGDSAMRLVSCNGTNYMIEKGIRKKRTIAATGLESWGLERAYFAPEDSGCSYETYAGSLERLIRSSTTNKEYLTDRGTAYALTVQTIADWQVDNAGLGTSPIYKADTIHFLKTASQLPRIAKSSAGSSTYLVNNGNKHLIAGTNTSDTNSLQLIRGYDVVPMATFSTGLLQTLTDAATIDYSFRVGSDWYLLDHNRTRKIDSASASRWAALTGPTLTSSVLTLFSTHDTINYYWKRDAYYYRLTEGGVLQRTTDASVVASWAITNPPTITKLLTNKIVEDFGVTDQP